MQQLVSGSIIVAAIAVGLAVLAVVSAWRSRARVVASRAQLESLRAQLEGVRAERARIESVAMSRRELTNFIVHDLRTPISGIVAVSEALIDGMASEPERFHRRIREMGLDLAAMLDDLDELARVESPTVRLSLTRLPLTQLVSGVVDDHRLLHPDRIIDFASTAPVMVDGDGTELRRAMTNLLRNAIEHSPGRVEVTVGIDSRGAVISVTDVGAGVGEGQGELLFEPGWRGAPAAAGGSGLGLAIARGVARAHAGDITVTNLAQGCRFDLVLPLAVDPVTQLTEMSRNGHGAIGSLTDPEPLSPTGIQPT
ncbi:sensor histidine kinase [Schumannella soli]|uniref:histidine kinase n=1 Tax=Schumannella soli TaxID=2590779 RepID=A0A506Y5Y6_9MICO|nr:HAMP domain-containing sensor histidine kinase [Schumannella soli]TPW78076.1 HAMP domain-containing histidine kinase [Schumannella soli]